MKNNNLIVGLVGLLVLVGLAYGASQYTASHSNPVLDRKEDLSATLGVDFMKPTGWKMTQYPDNLSFESPDLMFRCVGGVLYSPDKADENWSVPGDDTVPGPCFRAPIGRGSELSVTRIEKGIGETLDSIVQGWTDGQEVEVESLKVDGYNAVGWESQYGDSPANHRTVLMIKGNYIYAIIQSWGYDKPNPYPDLMDEVVTSFKFTD